MSVQTSSRSTQGTNHLSSDNSYIASMSKSEFQGLLMSIRGEIKEGKEATGNAGKGDQINNEADMAHDIWTGFLDHIHQQALDSGKSYAEAHAIYMQAYNKLIDMNAWDSLIIGMNDVVPENGFSWTDNAPVLGDQFSTLMEGWLENIIEFSDPEASNEAERASVEVNADTVAENEDLVQDNSANTEDQEGVLADASGDDSTAQSVIGSQLQSDEEGIAHEDGAVDESSIDNNPPSAPDAEVGVEEGVSVANQNMGNQDNSSNLGSNQVGYVEGLSEATVVGTIVGKITATDPEDGGPVSFELINNFDNAFTIDKETGEISVADPTKLDYEANPKPEITIRITDSTGSYTDHSVVINLTDVDERPYFIGITSDNIDENANTGSIVGIVQAADPEQKTISFTLLNDFDGTFAIDRTTGEISVVNSAKLDYEVNKIANITVELVDDNGNKIVQDITIKINDVNEPPVVTGFTQREVKEYVVVSETIQPDITPKMQFLDSLTFSPKAVPELAEQGTVVGKVSVNDISEGTVLEFTLVNDFDGAFIIDSKNGEIKVADGSKLNFESSVPAIQVKVTSNSGDEAIKTFPIILFDVNEPPIDINFNARELIENAPIGTIAGVVEATDPEMGDISFELLNDFNGAFTINEATGEISVIDGSKLDFEGLPPSFQVQVMDEDGLASVNTFSMILTDVDESAVNESPTALDFEFSGNDISMSSGFGVLVGVARASDPENDVLSYSLLSDSNGAFTINEETGEVSVLDASKLDLSNGNKALIEIQVTDEVGNSFQKEIFIDIIRANGAPLINGGDAHFTKGPDESPVLGNVGAQDN